MFRKLYLTLIVILFSGIAFADFKVETIADSTAVPSTSTTVYTNSFPIKSNTDSYIGVAYKSDVATGTTSIWFQQSFQRPTTENSSDATYLDTEGPWTLSDGNWHQATIDSVVMPYGRFKMKGSGTNPATTTIDIKVSKE